MNFIKKLKTALSMDSASRQWAFRFYWKKICYLVAFRWARFTGRKYWTVLVGGVRIDLFFDTAYHERIAYHLHTGRHEGNIMPWWVNEAHKITGHVYDVGGFNGIYGLLAAKANPSLAVHIFEPDPVNVNHIKRNIEKNNLHNCELRAVAVSNTKGSAHFAAFGNTGSHLTDEGGIEVTAVRLDDYSEPVALLKIDVEGNELEVLEGALDTIRQLNSIFIEIGPKTIESMGRLNKVRSILEQGGFGLPAEPQAGNYIASNKGKLEYMGA